MMKVGSALYYNREANKTNKLAKRISSGWSEKSRHYVQPSGFTVIGSFETTTTHTSGDSKAGARLKTKAESQSQHAYNQLYSGLVGLIPTIFGIIYALYAFKCLGRGQSGRLGGYMMVAGSIGMLIIWAAYKTIGLPESIILILPIIASVLAIIAKPLPPIPDKTSTSKA